MKPCLWCCAHSYAGFVMAKVSKALPDKGWDSVSVIKGCSGCIILYVHVSVSATGSTDKVGRVPGLMALVYPHTVYLMLPCQPLLSSTLPKMTGQLCKLCKCIGSMSIMLIKGLSYRGNPTLKYCRSTVYHQCVTFNKLQVLFSSEVPSYMT